MQLSLGNDEFIPEYIVDRKSYLKYQLLNININTDIANLIVSYECEFLGEVEFTIPNNHRHIGFRLLQRFSNYAIITTVNHKLLLFDYIKREFIDIHISDGISSGIYGIYDMYVNDDLRIVCDTNRGIIVTNLETNTITRVKYHTSVHPIARLSDNEIVSTSCPNINIDDLSSVPNKRRSFPLISVFLLGILDNPEKWIFSSGKVIVAIITDGSLIFMDPVIGTHLLTIKYGSYYGYPIKLLILPDTRIVIAMQNGNIKISDPRGRSYDKDIKIDIENRLIGIDILPDGLIVACSETKIFVLNPNTGNIVKTIITEQKDIRALVVLDDGRVVTVNLYNYMFWK